MENLKTGKNFEVNGFFMGKLLSFNPRTGEAKFQNELGEVFKTELEDDDSIIEVQNAWM